MKKLELEHLAPYLPYGLKFKDIPKGYEKERILSITNIEWCLVNGKPIFRPLSDLTRPIKVEGYNDGKEFVPMEELKKLFVTNIEFPENGNTIYLIQKTEGDLNILYLASIRDKICAWHFDVANLIGSGLAIDINTLNK